MPGIVSKRRVGSAVYILPNLLTTGNLFFGFFSIIKSLHGQFGWAAVAILLAAIFDVLDGRVARITHSSSEFGVQYDSLCDLVSFGLAPAFLMFQFGLGQLGRFGWMTCFIFLACGALRLARFNVISSMGKASGDFVGLPIPLAAINVACFVALMQEIFATEPTDFPLKIMANYLDKTFLSTWFLVVFGLFLAAAMVSNFPYRSHKKLNIKGVRPFHFLAILVVVFAMVGYMPEFFGFLIGFVYFLSGPVDWLLGSGKLTDDEIFLSDEHDGHGSTDDEALSPKVEN